MGRTAELVLGIVGGIFGIIAGLLALFVGGFGAILDVQGAETVMGLGFGAIILGVIGVIGGAIVNRNTKLASKLLVGGGVLGFVMVSIF
jgi:hypothetical protein